MTSLGVRGRTESWEAHERDYQFGETASTDIGKSQRLRKDGNARINKLSAMRPGLAKIIEKVSISRYFESSETDLHTAENTCCIDYADTWSSNKLLDCQKANIRIACPTIKDVKTQWNWTLELLEQAL